VRRIEAEILVRAPVERVWDVVTDFDRYDEWNRFTPRVTLATRDVRAGAEFDLDCQMGASEILRDEHEVILAVDGERHALCMGTSRVRGRPGIRSQRWQICEPGERGWTRFVNWEEFGGVLSPLVYLLYARKLRVAFGRYCEDLRTRAELLHGSK